MKKIAIITGATGGLGAAFISAVNTWDDIDEIWAIGRNTEKLANLSNSYNKTAPICADLLKDGVERLSEKLADEKPDGGSQKIFMKHRIHYERDELFDVSMVITNKIEITGKPSEDKLKDAFMKAVQNNEVLLTKIMIEDDGNAFYVENSMPKSQIRFVDEALETIRQKEEKKRFLVEEGEYIRAFVKENENDTSILFLMHHLAGDGKSLLYFIEDFLTFLCGGVKEYNGLRTAETKRKLDPVSKMWLHCVNRRWSGRVFTFDDAVLAFEHYWENRTTVIETEVIEKEEMDAILRRCHKAGIKFTAYLSAKLISESCKKTVLGYAVNYRHDKNRRMGNQVAAIRIKYRYNPSKTLIENAIQIQRRIDKNLNALEKGSYILNFVANISPTLRDAVNLEHSGYFHSNISFCLAKTMGYVGKTRDYAITNLSVADIPVKYGEYEIKQMMFAGPVVSYEKCVISAVTLNGKTVITTHTRKSIA